MPWRPPFAWLIKAWMPACWRGYGCAADDVGFADAAIRIDDASSFIAIHGAVMFGAAFSEMSGV